MRIVLATPLYPPDIAAPAPYIKELATRLSATHGITIVTYGVLPEKIEGVRIVTVSKRQPLPVRILRYTFALMSAVRGADVLIVENGASTELPSALISYISRAALILHMGDAAAHSHALESTLYGRIEEFARRRAKHVVSTIPSVRPEILPFVPYPTEAFAAYEASWGAHLDALNALFTHA